jgi:Ca-activated chloride channel family protein
MRFLTPVILLALSAAPVQACDVALVLAIDVSGSIDAGEYRIQSRGTAQALRDPAVAEALLDGGVALSLLHWSSVGQQAVVLPWARMQTPDDIARAAQAVESAPRAFSRSDTAVGDAVDAALALFDAVPDCARRIIDISGDGPENKGGSVRDSRARAIAKGVAINAIAIEDLGQSTAITQFYHNWVITRGGFVITSRGLAAYPQAIRTKLLRELEKPAS